MENMVAGCKTILRRLHSQGPCNLNEQKPENKIKENQYSGQGINSRICKGFCFKNEGRGRSGGGRSTSAARVRQLGGERRKAIR